MLQRRSHILRRIHSLIDAFLTSFSFVFIYLLRNHLQELHPFFKDWGTLHAFERYAPLVVIAALLWPILLNFHGLYETNRLRKAFVDVGIILRSSLEAMILLMTIIYLFHIDDISRFFIFGFGLLNGLGLVFKDLIRRQYALRRYLKGEDLRPLLVVGTRETATLLIQKIREENYLGLKAIGVVLPFSQADLQNIKEVPILGSLKNFREILHAHPIAHVLFAIPQELRGELERALAICTEEGVEAWVVSDLFSLNFPRMEIDYLAALPILVFRWAPILTWSYVFKLLLDRLLAGALLVFLSPLLFLIGLCILLFEGLPIFYRQMRVGRFGQPFQLHKFRTFDKEGLHPTRLGRGLRLLSLDELPQLFNILKGEMSFVGPRPHVPEEVKNYKEPWQRRRFSVLPGLTCYRQIMSPKKISFDDGLLLDLRYIENWSIWADFFLMFKTALLLMKRLASKEKS